MIFNSAGVGFAVLDHPFKVIILVTDLELHGVC